MTTNVQRRPTEEASVRDEGVDSGGICRNIARGQLPATASFGQQRLVSWHSVLQCVAASSSFRLGGSVGGSSLRIPPTVLCADDGAPEMYLTSTSRNGWGGGFASVCDIYVDRSEHRRDPRRVADEFLQLSRESGTKYVASMVDELGALRLQDIPAWQRIAKAGQFPPGARAVSAYVCPRGALPEDFGDGKCDRGEGKGVAQGNEKDVYCNFRLLYKLDKRASPVERCLRLNVAKEVTGRIGTSSLVHAVPSMQTSVNERMKSSVRSIVTSVEASESGRVTEIVVDFVHDHNDEVWVLRTASCRLAEESKMVSQKGEIVLKRSKANDKLSASLARRDCIQTNAKITANSRGDLPTKHDSDAVMLKRSATKSQAAPSLSSSCVVERTFDRGKSVSEQPMRCLVQEEYKSPVVAPSKLLRDLGATEVLGSTQLDNLCTGDFCKYDAKELMPLSSDLDDLGVGFGQAEQGVSRGNLRSKLIKLEKDTAKAEIETRWEEANRRSGAVISTERLYDMPQSVVIQAKKEKEMVEIFLRRQKRGHMNAEYIGAKGDDSLVLGESFPGHYYRTVKVCLNCYHVYRMVEKARKKQEEPLKSKPLSLSSQALDSSNTESLSEEPSVIKRAISAVGLITKSDLFELRSFSKPSPATRMVISATMIALGMESKSNPCTATMPTNVDNMFHDMRKFSPSTMSAAQVRELERYIGNESFRPETILSVSKAAAKLCGWVLGVVTLHKWETGDLVNERLDPLRKFDDFVTAAGLIVAPSKKAVSILHSQLNRGNKKPVGRTIVNARLTHRDRRESLRKYEESSPRTIKARHKGNGNKRLTYQKKKVDQLASKTVGNTFTMRTLVCSDGETRMPYQILGSNVSMASQTNFVVCHDIFDCLDATKLLFIKILNNHPGCQVLVFNQPGQAGTTFPRSTLNEKERKQRPALNNDFHAERLNELLGHVHVTGEFDVKGTQFHLVGIGNGTSIALSFVDLFGRDELYHDSLASIISVNGYCSIDKQLAAILHSAKNVFQSFPTSRPDLPVSYFSKYLFSEEYINRVTRSLALNIYTAVMNPISLEGRIQLIGGALKNRALKGVVNGLNIPIVAVQSTDNGLVQPSNIDVLLEGTATSHIWSHEINYDVSRDGNCYSGTALNDMLVACFRSRSSVAVFVRSGHALAQEFKASISDLFDCVLVLDKECSSLLAKEDVEEDKVTPAHSEPALAADSDTNSHQGVTSNDEPCSDDTLQHSQALATFVSDEDRARGYRVQDTTDEDTTERIEIGNVQHVEAMVTSIEQGSDLGGEIEVGKDGSLVDKPCLQDPHKTGEESSQKLHESEEAHCSDIRTLCQNEGNETGDVFAQRCIPQIEKEEGENSSVEIGSSKYIVRGAPNCTTSELDGHENLSGVNLKNPLLNEVYIPDIAHEAGSPAKVNHSAKINAKSSMPSLQEYIQAGIPLDFISPETIVAKPDKEQFKSRKWCYEDLSAFEKDLSAPPSVEELQSAFTQELEYERSRERERINRGKRLNEDSRMQSEIAVGQDSRRKQYGVEDEFYMRRVMENNMAREKERALQHMQRQVEIDEAESKLVQQGIVPAFELKNEGSDPVRTLPPTAFNAPGPVPKHMRKACLDGVFEDLEKDALVAKRRGIMNVEEFETIKNRLAQEHLEKEAKLNALEEAEHERILIEMATVLQRVTRGWLGRRKAARAMNNKETYAKKFKAVIMLQKYVRGSIGRKRANDIRQREILQLVHGNCIALIQRVWRGHIGRKRARAVQETSAALIIERVVRGHFGRNIAKKELERLEYLNLINQSALKIQCAWKKKVAIEEYRVLCLHRLASIQIQRTFRGFSGRRRASKLKRWAKTEPGPDRIKLGLDMIKESKDAFELQREEIDSLHCAQEKAEARVSQIFNELKESEKELMYLEKQLEGIDHIDNDFSDEKNLNRIAVEETPPYGSEPKITGLISNYDEEEGIPDRCAEDPYPLEIKLQDKKIQREKQRRHLESELSLVLSDVQHKRRDLEKLEVAIADMEETRKRKDREFGRLQRNLMELLDQQKCELDELREKGIELETATATTAAAAAATAQQAREHEQRTATMFNQQEELMKFQFMSMSLSYFSSLNMINKMRGISSDITSSAVCNSANTATAAAAAAAAASIPPSNHVNFGAKASAKAHQTGGKDAEQAFDDGDEKIDSLPDDCNLWTIKHVSQWLRHLSLDSYINNFEEACVDGEFLLELREEDMATVLGMEHKLHRKKLLLAREKIRPLSEKEEIKKELVLSEEEADANRGIPELDTVFSQVRHGRLKRLEESLDDGFDVDTQDEKGNTAIIIAVQNGQKRAMELLVRRGSDVNIANSNGNTPLHFALAYDKTGQVAEYLIDCGANDMACNTEGLTPYDGLGGDSTNEVKSLSGLV